MHLMGFDLPVHHVTLTVADLDRSVEWYCDTLDAVVLAERVGGGFRRILVTLPSGLVLGLTQHAKTPSGDRFDHRRVGLDHLSLAEPTAADVQAWADRWELRGIVHDALVSAPSGTLVVCYDPDGIPVEVYSPAT